MNPLTLCDAYKLGHRKQYPSGTTRVYSNWTPRESRVSGIDSVILFGLQYFLQRYLGEEFSWFFAQKPGRHIEAFTRRLSGYLGPNNVGTDHLEALHDLGYLPLEFRALPEGTRVPLRVPMLTVENTHPDFAWLVNYIETLMSCVLWLPCTSSTLAADIRRVLDAAAAKTGAPKEFVQWQGHDFSFRGMCGPEAASLSGAGHLLSFTGTDTIPSLDLIEEYYGPLPDGYLIGGSVPASEHSVMCAGGKENELQTFSRLLDLYPSGVVSVVGDTWDIWCVLTETLPALRDRIMARDGTLVVRPDSGNPADIVCGDPAAPEGTPAQKGVIELLWDVFGGTTTNTGHRQLDSHVGCIYGDGITRARAEEICSRLAAKGFASSNMVYGIGSFCVTPDTPILCSDLVWRAAGEVRPGQEIIAFDENPSFGNAKRISRRYRTATIEFNESATKTCIRIATDIGDPVTASADHPWLVMSQNRNSKRIFIGDNAAELGRDPRSLPRTSGLEWKTTEELVIGDRIAFFSKPWKQDDTRDGGWLAGMFDGEGSLSRSTPDDVRIPAWKVNISQNQGPTLERIRSELTRLGWDLYEVRRKCPQLVLLGGWTEVIRFLGIIKPGRLMEKFPRMLAEMPGLVQGRTYELATVTSIEPRGERPVASIKTSCGTFITGGYLSHNTYQHVTRDTFGFAMKSTWCEVGGFGRDIFKQPVTDSGMKNSAVGRLAVLTGSDGKMKLVNRASGLEEADSLLRPVWRDGKFIIKEDFKTIRDRALGEMETQPA